MNNKYLTQRLQALSITEEDNTCQGFSTFSAHPYYIVKDEYYNLTNKELERFRPSPFDNILFSYSTIWGKRIFYRTKTSKWQKTVERIRYNEKNRYQFWDRDTNKIKRLHKYHTQKGGKAFAFFNGLYAYYIKPLQAQGYAETQIIEQLRPTFRRIIITEGEFKAFAGCQHQIPTIGIVGINSAVHTVKQMHTTKDQREYEYTTDAHFLTEIREFLVLFQVQEVVFLMDGDAFENKEKTSRSKSFYGAVRNIYYATCNAKVQLHFAYIQANVGGKGLDDILQIGNRAMIREELQQMVFDPTYITQFPLTTYEQLEKLQFAFAQSVQGLPYFFATNRRIIKAAENVKLADILNIEETYDKILDAPTGTGKTYLVATCSDWKILVCPTISLCKNVATKYNAYHFEGKDLALLEQMIDNWEAFSSIYQFIRTVYADVSDAPVVKHPNFIVVTYKSFRKLTAYFTRHTNKFRVFIDESQNFTISSNPSYLLKELGEIAQLSAAYKSVTLLTGTYLPTFHPTIAQMPVLQVRIPKPAKSAKLLACTNTLKAAAQLAKQSIQQQRFPMILFNSKNDSGKLGTLKTYLQNLDFAFFNANTKTDKDWQEIAQNGQITTTYQGICVTSVLKEGNNIYNNYDFDIIILGSFHSSEIEQFCNRPRQAKSIQIFKLIGEKAKVSTSQQSIYSIATSLLYRAIATCHQLNSNEDNLAFDLLEREFTARQFIAALPIQLDSNGLCQVDELRLSNQAFQLDRIQENRNEDLLRRRLARYNIQLKEVQLYETVTTETEIAASKESRLAAKNKKEQDFDGLYKNLQTLEIYTHASKQLTHRAKQLSSVEKNVYKQIQSVTNLITDKKHVLAMLEKARLSNSKFTLLRRQYIIHCLRSSREYINSKRLFAKLLQEMYTAFSLGERLIPSDIKGRLLKVLAQDSSLDTSRIKKDRSNRLAVQLFRFFFDYKVVRHSRKRFYEVMETYWSKELPVMEIIPSNILLTADGYPSFWKDVV